MQLRQEIIPVGWVPSAAVAVGGRCLPRGVSTRGMSVLGGVLPGGVLPERCLPREVSAKGRGGVCRGMSAQGGVYQGGCLPQCMLGYTPLPVDGKNFSKKDQQRSCFLLGLRSLCAKHFMEHFPATSVLNQLDHYQSNRYLRNGMPASEKLNMYQTWHWQKVSPAA